MTVFNESGVRVERHDSGLWLISPIVVDMNRDERERLGAGEKETVPGRMMLPLDRIQICEMYGYYDQEDNRGEVTVFSYVPLMGGERVSNKLDARIDTIILALNHAYAFNGQLREMRDRN